MQIRKILTLAFVVMMVTALVLPAGPAFAADPPGQQGKELKLKGKVTVEERLAAGQVFADAFAAVVGPGIIQPLATETHQVDLATGRLIPHYFGPYPNYALSPLPIVTTDPITGAITNVTGGLRKFVDSLPGLTPAGINNLGQYIPLADADKVTYSASNPGYTGPDSDYYEIAVVEYNEQMHSDLPGPNNLVNPGLGTRLRGYVQLETAVVTGDSVPLFYPNGDPIYYPGTTNQVYAVDKPHYLGPTIIANSGTPVRVKFYNLLPYGPEDPITGKRPGDLFIPVDTTVMGAGMGPVMDPVTGQPIDYTQNRATLHLHGGITPWISDGTPHQWITPADEDTPYPQGVSVSPVPDMGEDPTDPTFATDGVMTFYYTNQQGARIQFYHDHAFGITRLNVLAGEAAGYLIRDLVEKDLIDREIIPGAANEIPLVIQDKTFVADNVTPYSNILGDWESQMGFYDPTWDYSIWGGYGDIWYPHVYMPVQNPYDPSGINAFGRWQYGPWFWPPVTPVQGPQPNPYANPANPGYSPLEPPMIPGVPIDSMGMESFFDTPLVNGTAYPFLEVDPTAYRFRILNAANDRFWNLQLYVADPNVVTFDGRTNTEVRMVPATPNTGLPADWPTDGREMGVPDPAMAGPDFIQIGSESGFLPEPAVLPNRPVSWNLDQTTFAFGIVDGGTLILGPAERADVVVDFSQYAGQTLILYNDSPAPFPAWTPQFDYYTGSPDLTDTGGAPGTIPGYGPNTRTIMQIKVRGGVGADLGVGSVSLSSGGSGYTNPVVEFIGGGASVNATAYATGSVDRISLNNMGSGYTNPIVTIGAPPAGGTQATAAATTVAGFITGFTITQPGSGYTSAPAVIISDTGINAAARATLTVTGVTMTNNGTAYQSVPTVVIRENTAAGDGAGASASAVLVNASPLPAYDLAALQAEFITVPDVQDGVFKRGQPDIIVGQTAYDNAYGTTFPSTAPFWGVSGIGDSTLSFQTVLNGTANITTSLAMKPKAIQDEMGEAFDTEYGRMSGFLGVELPNTAAVVQAFTLYPFIAPPVEVIATSIYGTQIGELNNGTQIWKITHNGVDTHPVHWHMFEVQLINRVAWDNSIMMPDANELGWKETIRISPLMDTIVALRPIAPDLPFDIPNSVRLMDPTKAEHAVLPGGPGGFFDPLGRPIVVTNEYVNYGWEYVWHCHILSHEEMDMMHGMAVGVAPNAPTGLAATVQGNRATLTWADNSLNETSFTIQRATNAAFTAGLVTNTVGVNTTTFVSTGLSPRTTYYFRVFASNTIGDTTMYDINGVPTQAFPVITIDSGFSNVITVVR